MKTFSQHLTNPNKVELSKERDIYTSSTKQTADIVKIELTLVLCKPKRMYGFKTSDFTEELVELSSK